MEKRIVEILKGFLWGCLLCGILWLVWGCSSTKYVSVPEYHLQYVNKTDSFLAHDSIYLHDSIFSYVHGDTVFMNKYKTKYVESIRNVIKNDTICKRDSIPYKVEVVKTKTKTDYTGWFVALALAVVMGLYIKRKLS